MFETLVTGLLTNLLGSYIDAKCFSSDRINIAVWSGYVVLRHLVLRSDLFDHVPTIRLLRGICGSIELKIPWNRLQSDSVVITIDDLYLLMETEEDIESVLTAQDQFQWKKQMIDQLYAKSREKQQLQGKEMQRDHGFTARLINKILDNIEIHVRNVHIRLHDLSSGDHPFSVGLTVESIHAQSTNASWTPSFIDADRSDNPRIYKSIEINHLSVYLNPDVDLCAQDSEVESNESMCGSLSDFDPCASSVEEFCSVFGDLIPKRSHSGIYGTTKRGSDAFQLSLKYADRLYKTSLPPVLYTDVLRHHFILKPMDVCARVKMNREMLDKSIPSYEIDVTINEVAIQLEESQYCDSLHLLAALSIPQDFSRYQEYCIKRTSTSLSQAKTARERWRCAIQETLAKIRASRMQISSSFLCMRREDRTRYIWSWQEKTRMELDPQAAISLTYESEDDEEEDYTEESIHRELGMASDSNAQQNGTTSSSLTNILTQAHQHTKAKTYSQHRKVLDEIERRRNIEEILFFRYIADSTFTFRETPRPPLPPIRSSVTSSSTMSDTESVDTDDTESVAPTEARYKSWGQWIFGWTNRYGGATTTSDAGEERRLLPEIELRELFKILEYEPAKRARKKRKARRRYNQQFPQDSSTQREQLANDNALLFSRITLELIKGSISLANDPKVDKSLDRADPQYSEKYRPTEFLLVTFTHLTFAAISNDDNHKFELSLHSIEAFDEGSDSTAFSRLLCRKSEGMDFANPLLNVQPDLRSRTHSTFSELVFFMRYEINPEPANVDTSFFAFLEPLQVIFSPTAKCWKRLTSFLGTPRQSGRYDELEVASLNDIVGVKARTEAKLNYVMENRVSMVIDLRIRAPEIIIPADDNDINCARLVIDLGLLTFRTERLSTFHSTFVVDGDGNMNPCKSTGTTPVKASLASSQHFSRQLADDADVDEQYISWKEEFYDKHTLSIANVHVLLSPYGQAVSRRDSRVDLAFVSSGGRRANDLELLEPFSVHSVIRASILPLDATLTRLYVHIDLPELRLHFSIEKYFRLMNIVKQFETQKDNNEMDYPTNIGEILLHNSPFDDLQSYLEDEKMDDVRMSLITSEKVTAQVCEQTTKSDADEVASLAESSDTWFSIASQDSGRLESLENASFESVHNEDPLKLERKRKGAKGYFSRLKDIQKDEEQVLNRKIVAITCSMPVISMHMKKPRLPGRYNPEVGNFFGNLGDLDGLFLTPYNHADRIDAAVDNDVVEEEDTFVLRLERLRFRFSKKTQSLRASGSVSAFSAETISSVVSTRPLKHLIFSCPGISAPYNISKPNRRRQGGDPRSYSSDRFTGNRGSSERVLTFNSPSHEVQKASNTISTEKLVDLTWSSNDYMDDFVCNIGSLHVYFDQTYVVELLQLFDETMRVLECQSDPGLNGDFLDTELELADLETSKSPLHFGIDGDAPHNFPDIRLTDSVRADLVHARQKMASNKVGSASLMDNIANYTAEKTCRLRLSLHSLSVCYCAHGTHVASMALLRAQLQITVRKSGDGDVSGNIGDVQLYDLSWDQSSSENVRQKMHLRGSKEQYPLVFGLDRSITDSFDSHTTPMAHCSAKFGTAAYHNEIVIHESSLFIRPVRLLLYPSFEREVFNYICNDLWQYFDTISKHADEKFNADFDNGSLSSSQNRSDRDDTLLTPFYDAMDRPRQSRLSTPRFIHTSPPGSDNPDTNSNDKSDAQADNGENIQDLSTCKTMQQEFTASKLLSIPVEKISVRCVRVRVELPLITSDANVLIFDSGDMNFAVEKKKLQVDETNSSVLIAQEMIFKAQSKGLKIFFAGTKYPFLLEEFDTSTTLVIQNEVCEKVSLHISVSPIVSNGMEDSIQLLLRSYNSLVLPLSDVLDSQIDFANPEVAVDTTYSALDWIRYCSFEIRVDIESLSIKTYLSDSREVCILTKSLDQLQDVTLKDADACRLWDSNWMETTEYMKQSWIRKQEKVAGFDSIRRSTQSTAPFREEQKVSERELEKSTAIVQMRAEGIQCSLRSDSSENGDYSCTQKLSFDFGMHAMSISEAFNEKDTYTALKQVQATQGDDVGKEIQKCTQIRIQAHLILSKDAEPSRGELSVCMDSMKSTILPRTILLLENFFVRSYLLFESEGEVMKRSAIGVTQSRYQSKVNLTPSYVINPKEEYLSSSADKDTPKISFIQSAYPSNLQETTTKPNNEALKVFWNVKIELQLLQIGLFSNSESLSTGILFSTQLHLQSKAFESSERIECHNRISGQLRNTFFSFGYMDAVADSLLPATDSFIVEMSFAKHKHFDVLDTTRDKCPSDCPNMTIVMTPICFKLHHRDLPILCSIHSSLIRFLHAQSDITNGLCTTTHEIQQSVAPNQLYSQRKQSISSNISTDNPPSSLETQKEATTESRSIQVTCQPLDRVHIKWSMQRLQVVLLNDLPGQSVVQFDFQLSKLQANFFIDPYTAAYICGAGEVCMEAWYYNDKLLTLEPFIEPYRVELEISDTQAQRKAFQETSRIDIKEEHAIDPLSIKVHSDSTLQVNVSEALIATGIAAFRSCQNAFVNEEHVSKVSEESSYHLYNQTGLAIKYWGPNCEMKILKPDERGSILFKQNTSKPTHIVAPGHPDLLWDLSPCASIKGYPRCLFIAMEDPLETERHFGVSTMQTSIMLDQLEASTRIFLYAGSSQSFMLSSNRRMWECVIDIRKENRRKYFTIRSLLVLENHTNLSLIIKLESQRKDPALDWSMTLSEGSSLPVPIYLTTIEEGCLCVSLSENAGTDISNNFSETHVFQRIALPVFEFENIVEATALQTVIKFQKLLPARPFPLYTAPSLYPDPKHGIGCVLSFTPPLKLHNLLAFDVDYYLSTQATQGEGDTVPRSRERGHIEIGDSIIWQLSPSNVPLELSIRMQGYDWSEVMVITNDMPALQYIRMADTQSHAVLYVSLESKMTNTQSKELWLYVPYWIMNMTGLELKYEHDRELLGPEHVVLDLAGQRFVNRQGREKIDRAHAQEREYNAHVLYPCAKARRFNADNPVLDQSTIKCQTRGSTRSISYTCGLIDLLPQEKSKNGSANSDDEATILQVCDTNRQMRKGSIRLRVVKSEYKEENGLLWSDTLRLDLIGAIGELSVADTDSNRLYSFGYAITSGKGHFARTKVITLTPRIMIVNTLDLPIQICHSASKWRNTSIRSVFRSNLYAREDSLLYTGSSDAHILAKSYGVFHWTLASSNKKFIRCRIAESGWNWCGSIQITDATREYAIRLRHENTRQSRLIRITIKADHCCIYVTICDDNIPPYRLENYSLETFRLHQQHVDQSEIILPHHSLDYAWDEPLKPHLLVVDMLPSAAGDNSRPLRIGTLSLDTLQSFSSVISGTLVFSVSTDGPTKVLRFEDTRIRPLRVDSANKKQLHNACDQLKQYIKEPSVIISMRLCGFGVSLIDATPKELLYLSVSEINFDALYSERLKQGQGRTKANLFSSCEKDCGHQTKMAYLHPRAEREHAHFTQFGFHLRIGGIQVDNQLSHTPYPVLLRFKDVYSQHESTFALSDESSVPSPLPALKFSFVHNDEYEGINFIHHFSCQLLSMQLRIDGVLFSHLIPFFRYSKEVRGKDHDRLGVHTHDTYRNDAQDSILMDLQHTLAVHVPLLTEMNRPDPAHVPNGEYVQDTLRPSKRARIRFHTQGAAPLEPKRKKMYFEEFFIGTIEATVSFTTGTSTANGASPSSHITVDPFRLLLNAIGTSFTKIANAPFKLHELRIIHSFVQTDVLAKRLLSHYQSEVIRQAYVIVGSVDVLGNPMTAWKNLTAGFRDFLNEPRRGLHSKGTKGFVIGLGRGTVALARASIYTFLDFNARSLTATSLGLSEACAKLDAYTGYTPTGNIFLGIAQGVSGIIVAPIHAVEKNGIRAALPGLFAGMLGLIFKPLLALSLASQIGATTMRNSVRPRNRVLIARIRPPRFIDPRDRKLCIYSLKLSLGEELLCKIRCGRLRNERYLGHMRLQEQLLMITTKRIMCLFECPTEDGMGLNVAWGIHAEELILVLISNVSSDLPANHSRICFYRFPEPFLSSNVSVSNENRTIGGVENAYRGLILDRNSIVLNRADSDFLCSMLQEQELGEMTQCSLRGSGDVKEDMLMELMAKNSNTEIKITARYIHPYNRYPVLVFQFHAEAPSHV